MKKSLRRFLPDPETVRANRWFRPFRTTLLHPRLWHLNRHSAAGAVAVGLFCGLVPGPLQMLSAAFACMLFRVNLPLALVTTLYSNPFTIVPLYFVAYVLGALLLGQDSAGFIPPPEMAEAGLAAWTASLLPWGLELGKPLALGLVVLAALLATSGYFGVRTAWRIWLVRAWRNRNVGRASPPQA